MFESSEKPFGSTNVTFAEALNQKKMETLRSVAKEYFPELASAKPGKEELSKKLASALLDDDNADIFVKSLTSMDRLFYECFLQIIDREIIPLPINTDKPEEARVLRLFKECIYLHCYSMPGVADLHVCVIPVEVRKHFAKYRKICEERLSPLARIQQYIGAAVRLYGLITPEEFKEIVNRYEPELLQDINEKDLPDLFQAGERSFPIYLYVRPNLVHPSVYHFHDDVEKSIGEFLDIRYNGSRWYPKTRKEFLSFIADKSLCNPKDREALADVFQEDGVESDEICEDLINHMIELIQIGMHPKNLVCMVARIEECVMEPDWQENLLAIFTRLERSTRLMRYNGYTLDEIEPALRSERLHDLAKDRFGGKE